MLPLLPITMPAGIYPAVTPTKYTLAGTDAWHAMSALHHGRPHTQDIDSVTPFHAARTAMLQVAVARSFYGQPQALYVCCLFACTRHANMPSL